MRATVHFNGPGAKLNEDDIAAAVELYPVAPRRRPVRR